MNGKWIRGYLLAGLVVWIPVLATFWIVRFIVDLLDQTIELLPTAYQPQQLLGFKTPGIGVLFSLILLLVTGLIATNFVGARLFQWSESLLDRIPLVRTVYNATKQMIQALLSSNSQAFRQVLLIEYPRKGIWTLAFQTGVVRHEISEAVDESLIAVFVPTTPNPTGGYLMMLPKKDAIVLSMSVDEALKLIISLGVIPKGK